MLKTPGRRPAREGFIVSSNVSFTQKPVALPSPAQQGGSGKLTLKKENGTVKGFEYRCLCGHCDTFVFE